jgi:hypothetical protein
MSELFDLARKIVSNEGLRSKKINPIAMTFLPDENSVEYGEKKVAKDWRSTESSDKRSDIELIFHPIDRIF